MAKGVIDVAILDGIAEAIQAKLGTTEKYLPSQMAEAILSYDPTNDGYIEANKIDMVVDTTMGGRLKIAYTDVNGKIHSSTFNSTVDAEVISVLSNTIIYIYLLDESYAFEVLDVNNEPPSATYHLDSEFKVVIEATEFLRVYTY